MAAKEVSQSVEIAGTPKACFEAITDYESYPEWQKTIQHAAILERDDDGRGSLVEYGIDVLVKQFKYALRYSYGKDLELSWTLHEGPWKQLDGRYRFEALGKKKTRATLTLVVDAGMFVPGPIVKKLNEVLMRGSVEALKQRVEGG